jgi:hypothetical protein
VQVDLVGAAPRANDKPATSTLTLPKRPAYASGSISLRSRPARARWP